MGPLSQPGDRRQGAASEGPSPPPVTTRKLPNGFQATVSTRAVPRNSRVPAQSVLLDIANPVV